ncbi:MAG: hypothetical protein U9Q34_03125 [Elusimicrobiota bacterium]|nr:hypothetical protein [Elusimicrobiota bacterium]
MLKMKVKKGNAKTKKAVKTAKSAKAVKKNIKRTVKTTTKKNEYLVMDHPKNNETIRSWHYAVRVGAGANCKTVDISIDDGPWQPCRHSNGYWWYDWTNYTPGTHQLVARMTKTNGQYLITKKRRCRTV